MVTSSVGQLGQSFRLTSTDIPINSYCNPSTMTSADFLVYRNSESNPRPPLVRVFSFLQSLRHLLLKALVFFGRHKDAMYCACRSMLVYPLLIASYTVPVRQYRIFVNSKFKITTFQQKFFITFQQD